MRLLWMTLVVWLVAVFVSAQSGLPHNIPNFCAVTTVQAVASGAWNDPVIWSTGLVPMTGGERVSIPAGITVDFDSLIDQKLDTTCIYGTLRYRTDRNTRLTVGTLMIFEGGLLEIGTPTSPIQPQFIAEVVIADLALSPSTVDPEQFGNGVLAFGGLHTHGAIRTPTFDRLTVEAPMSASMLSVETPTSGWRQGDQLVLPDSRNLQWNEVPPRFVPQWEELTLAGSGSGSEIMTTQQLRFAHSGARNGDGVLEFLPHIANLTRNVVFRSQNAAGTRGHVLATSRADVDIRYTRFKDLGRTLSTPLDSTTFGSGGAVTHLGTNQIGRYALHMHHLMGPVAEPASGHQFVLLGNAIDGSTKWGIAIHNSHFGLIRDNVIYDANGAGLACEDGSESYNIIEHNFAVRITGAGGRGDNRMGQNPLDLGFDGVGFWFRGVNNFVRNNVAANVYNGGPDAYGFKYFQVGTGNVHVPLFPGADTMMAGQYVLQDSYNLPIREFSGNEVYASTSGMTYWWIGTLWRDGPRLGVGESVIKDFRVWNAYNIGIFAYESNHLTVDGFVMRGPNSSQTACCSVGFGANDYFSRDFKIIRANIQGMQTGISPTTDTGWTPQLITDSYLRNRVDLSMGTLWTSSGSALGIPTRQVIARNVRFAGTKAIELQYSERPTRSVIRPDQLFVYDYNQVAGQDFQVYYAEQSPGFLVPQTATIPGQGQLEGAPVAGLTNLQTKAQFDVAIAGAVSPCGTTMPAIDGFVCNSTMPPPPPPTCTQSLAPVSQAFLATGGPGSASLTTGSTCAWMATSSVPWVTLTSASGTGNAAIGYSVQASISTQPRTGLIQVGSAQVSVTQAGVPPPPTCSLQVAPISQAFLAAGGTGTASLTTGNATCPWTATTSALWLTLTSPASGTGPATVSYSVAPSALTVPRTALVQVGAALVTVTQASAVVVPPPTGWTRRVYDLWTGPYLASVSGRIPNEGSAWVQESGIWRIQINNVGTSGASGWPPPPGNVRLRSSTPLGANQAIEASASVDRNNPVGLLLKMDTAGNGYVVVWQSGSVVTIGKLTAGVRTILGSVSAPASVVGDLLRFEADASGHLTALINGVQKLAVMDTTFSGSFAGLFGLKADEYQMLDNVSAFDR